jgi:hypothetical protein
LPSPKDRSGKVVSVGTHVRLLGLSGKWFDDLSPEEKNDVLSMVGEVFEIEEIDEYGQAWICKWWPNKAEGTSHSHSVALESHEMEVVNV